jgi:4-alpha-glucanotransferase
MSHTSERYGMSQREAGVLLHPTSLPGPYGVGDLGDESIAFLDWAQSAGMRIWQVLPLNPPGYGNSPYGCHSSFAGNPLLISPQRLAQFQLLPATALADVPTFPDDHADFDRTREWKTQLLRKSWRHFKKHATDVQRQDLSRFTLEQAAWLDDWATYSALKDRNGGAAWWDWKPEIASRNQEALARVRRELADTVAFHEYVQWLFAGNWNLAREAAHERGIRIMGDVPIYVAADSADVWSHRDLFQLDEHGQPTVVAGVPPDYFSETGQRWGNPLYRWDVMRERGFDWWVARVRRNLQYADILRLDHFRGFAAYWEIPAHESTAIHGRWMPGPGRALFDALRAELGDLPLVAEDLGFITPEVHELRKATGLPGMKILQFGFASVDSPHLPHRYEAHTVVYTGTHDNDTANGWYASAPPNERQLAAAYLGPECDEISWALIRTAYASVAEMSIVPVQDILGLGTEARMNRPGDAQHNWSWRLAPGALTRAQAERLATLAKITGR